ncbi:ribosome maturation factor RimM [Desulforegula conservatrix]|uniref:ribosome maturation factor RimM n=1 Tax=Desulforegula conservatrix TaxID=153026 RepID=UPI00040DA6FF|nr:ribosome maturation factor RimM [Desulforegula conservatrix]
MTSELLLVAKTSSAHGLYGKIRIVLFTEDLGLFKKGRKVLISREGKNEKSFEIVSASPYKRKFAILTLSGIDDRNQAEEISGYDMFVDKAYLPPLESEDTFYWKDLIGISVYDEEGTFLGILESIIETGSNDVYVVKKDEEEILIPALASVVKAVDVSKRSMHVSIPEGLL